MRHPSPLLFNLLSLHDVRPELATAKASGHHEASLLGASDETAAPANKSEVVVRKVRGRPTAAQVTNTWLRIVYSENTGNSEPVRLGGVQLTKGLQSHSIRRGAAQFVNACHKIPIQWLCTRGLWAMDSLCKAFAYVGTTLQDDHKVARRLSGYDPDAEVVCPSLGVLEATLTTEEQAALLRCQKHLFDQSSGFMGAATKCNVRDTLENLCFATLLTNLEAMEAVSSPSNLYISSTMDVCDASECSVDLLRKAASHMRVSLALHRGESQSSGADSSGGSGADHNTLSTLQRLGQKVDMLQHTVLSLKQDFEQSNARQVPSVQTRPPRERAHTLRSFAKLMIPSFVFYWLTC